MPEIEVNIELYCDTCGSGLCSQATVTRTRNMPSFRIEACDSCTKKSHLAGYEEGYKKGYEDARGGK
jgi:hypothetical protein